MALPQIIFQFFLLIYQCWICVLFTFSMLLQINFLKMFKKGLFHFTLHGVGILKLSF